MFRRPEPVLSHLRGRLWRLTVLWLWAAVFIVNLAAALTPPAAAGSLALDQQASVCHSGGGEGTAPLNAAGDPSVDPHCALCHVFAAGVLATPGDVPLALLSPAAEVTPVSGAATAAPQNALPSTQAQPRAPPASV